MFSTPAPSLNVCSQRDIASKNGLTPTILSTKLPISMGSRDRNQTARNADRSDVVKLSVVTESTNDIDVHATEVGDKADSNTRRSLWNPDMAQTSSEEREYVFANIISKYTMIFGDKPTPRIPLCKLTSFLRVRNFQTTFYMTQQLKHRFETHCYNENGARFHVFHFDENGKKFIVMDEDPDKAKGDVLWRTERERDLTRSAARCVIIVPPVHATS
ncbi:hypothetical protein R1sor_012940 [Riccia sorocarpa]|uniref:Uncharacterized protein n=1 Tax=Riccia sorocarpa TaxID=122646 RepID=A0ABD3I8L5_9MARC